MAYETVLYDVQDQILTITLNRPEKLNAFTHGMLDELIDAFDRADADDEVRGDHRHRRGPRVLRRRRHLAAATALRRGGLRRRSQRRAGRATRPSATAAAG